MSDHPEFQPVWERWTEIPAERREPAGLNPVTHIAYHAIVRAQATGELPEAGRVFRALQRANATTHQAEHGLMAILEEETERSLATGRPFDLPAYRARLAYLADDYAGGVEYLPQLNLPCRCRSGRKAKDCCMAGALLPFTS